MASYMDATRLERFLVHILSPVYRIIEDDTIRDAHMGKCLMVSMIPVAHDSESALFRRTQNPCH